MMVTKCTKAGQGPSSAAYLNHLLDSCGEPPRAPRCTRLVDLVNTAFGMNPEGVTFYLADHVEPGRLPVSPPGIRDQVASQVMASE